MKVCSVCRRCYDNFDVSCIDAAHPTLSETHAFGREIVDGYSLDVLLESGLGGEIFQSHQLATNASCIIRIIATSEKERERSVREAKSAAAIFHPNVADVYEAGSLESGQLYVVSEYPAGQTLRQLLEKVRIPELLTAISILSQTAEALHTLHQNGITHNAVRPENIVLTTDPDGQLLVRIQNIDHGGVGFRAIISNKFMIDSALDSLRYFAPEQCTGESAGPQTDVYSLGVVFFEMLAGRPPFDASTATALIHKQRNERPPDVRIENFQLRMLLTHSLMESLHKQPMYRTGSADKFARQMRHMEQLATHVSTPPPAGAVPETAVKPAPPLVTPPPPPAAKRSRPMPVVIDVPEPAPVLFDEPVAEEMPIVKAAPVIAKEPVCEVATVVELEPVRETVTFADPIPDPLPVAEPEPVRESVSLSDLIPDPLPIVEIKPVPATETSQSALLMDPIPDPLPIIKPEPGLSVEPEMAVEAVDLAREESNRTPRRSRLKTWKKKLHAMSSSVARTPQAEKSAMVVDTPEITTNAPIEMSIVESPPTGELAPEPVKAAVITDDKRQFVAPVDVKPPVARATENKPQFVVPAANEPQLTARVEAPAIPIELTTLELPPELTSERKADTAPVKIESRAPAVETRAPVTRVETCQTNAPIKAAKGSTRAATPTAAKAPVAEASIKRNTPHPLKADAVAPDMVAKPASLETMAEPITMEPPRLVVEERVVRATPKKIQWQQPDDDIPSEADVLDALVKDGVIDETEKYTGRVFTMTTPKSADGPIPAAKISAPPPVVPAKSADGPVKSAAPTRAKAEMQPPAKVKKSSPSVGAKAVRKTTPPPPPSVVDQEEITLVRPPRQIRINLEKGAAQNIWTPPRPTPETDFFPTLLGEREKPRHIQPPPSEAMFSTYYSAPVKKTPIPYRTVMFGGGVIVLVVTFLIGDGFVGDHVQSKNESVASKTTTAPRAKKIPPVGLKSAEKPREETVVDESDLKPLPDNDRLTRTIADKPGTVEKTAAVKKDTSKSATRDYTPAPPRPTPRPTPADTKKKAEPVQQTRVIGIKSSPAQTNPNIATRPRVVKDPK